MKHFRNYYIFILVITILIIIVAQKPFDAYGIVFYMLLTVPLFFGSYYIHFRKFSKKLKNEYPILFEKYKLKMGTVEQVNFFDCFNNQEFEQLSNKSLLVTLKKAKNLLVLTSISFIMTIILAVVLISVKR